MNRKRNCGWTTNKMGFSLLELLIALFLLTIGLMAAAGMQGIALRSDSFAYRNTTVTTIAQQVMDDLMSAPILYQQPPSGWYQIFTTAANNLQYNRFPPNNSTTYTVDNVGTCSATYSILPNTPATNITQVTVQVLMSTSTGTIRLPFVLVGHREIPSTSL